MLQHVYVPTDIGDAIARLSSDATAALLSGGTLLMPVINNETSAIRSLVSTRRLSLHDITVDGDRVRIGAGTTIADVGRDARLVFLRPVVESIASPPIRNLATVGGNLFAPQPYGDFAVALLALDASVHLASAAGEREAALASVLNQGVTPGEIVIEVAFTIPADGTWFYAKAMRRKLNSAAIVTVAAVIDTGEDVVTAARVALGGAGPRPVRASSVEQALIGRTLNAETVAAASALAINDAAPFSDAYASAWYRACVLPVHIRRAILGE